MAALLTGNATQHAARQTTSHAGCVNIVRPFYRMPWHRGHGDDLRYPAHDHHDVFSNAIRVELIAASFGMSDHETSGMSVSPGVPDSD